LVTVLYGREQWQRCVLLWVRRDISVEAAMEWIKCSDRLPENKPGSIEYIVFDTLCNRAHHDYWNVPGIGDDEFTPFWNHFGKYVTHWMPLPPPPAE
jgi:hypothetical protein